MIIIKKYNSKDNIKNLFGEYVYSKIKELEEKYHKNRLTFYLEREEDYLAVEFFVYNKKQKQIDKYANRIGTEQSNKFTQKMFDELIESIDFTIKYLK